MYGNPVKSPFPSHSTGRGEAAVNNRYIARGRNGESREEKIPCTRTTFLSLSASCLQYFMHSFSPASFFCPPHLSSVRLNLLYFLALSVLFLLFLRAWWMIAERKVELDASLKELSFETCRRFCFVGVSCYSSLAHHHPKHQLSVTASYGPSEYKELATRAYFYVIIFYINL